MNQDSALYRWLLKQQKKNDIKEGMGTGFKHRSAYHKEFTGYAEIRVPQPGGRYRIERIYVAPWNRHDISDMAWILMKLFYAFSVVVTAVLYVIAAIQDTEWNYSRVTGILECLGAIALVVFAARVIILLATPRNMTNGQCNNVDRPLTRWSLIAFISVSVVTLWNLIFLIFFRQSSDFLLQSASLWMLIPGSILQLSVWLYQRRMTFKSLPNENSPGEDQESYVIK